MVLGFRVPSIGGFLSEASLHFLLAVIHITSITIAANTVLIIPTLIHILLTKAWNRARRSRPGHD